MECSRNEDFGLVDLLVPYLDEKLSDGRGLRLLNIVLVVAFVQRFRMVERTDEGMEGT